MPGPSVPARTDADYARIAQIIQQIDAKILLLQEIHAEEVELEGEAAELRGETDVRAPALERLIGELGASNWDYVVGESGGTRHIAILFDTRFARLNDACEAALPERRTQGESLFDRQPLYAHFTFLQDGQDRNDLVVVSIHLASGQRNNRNHDAAMRGIVQEIEEARDLEFCIPSNEHDVLIAGDFNANRFDTSREEFWDEMESNSWDVLADDLASYSATRLSGVPLRLRNSVIDYIIVGQNRRNMLGFGPRGLREEEVSAATATVHTELAGDAEAFRRQASDHLPVTVQIRVIEDND